MRAQITFEYLTTILIFIICITLITTAVLSHFSHTTSLQQKNSQTESLSIIALNLGILQTSTNSLSVQIPITNTEIRLDENTVRSNEAFAYTVNSGEGIKYAQNKNTIPQ